MKRPRTIRARLMRRRCLLEERKRRTHHLRAPGISGRRMQDLTGLGEIGRQVTAIVERRANWWNFF